jgi:hypothetical protein
MNTSIEYLYWDQENNKATAIVILPGELTPQQIDAIRQRCHHEPEIDDEDWFIPSQVGMEPLYGELGAPDPSDPDLDGPWHLLVEIKPTDAAPTTKLTAEMLYNHFMEIREWDMTVGGLFPAPSC